MSDVSSPWDVAAVQGPPVAPQARVDLSGLGGHDCFLAVLVIVSGRQG